MRIITLILLILVVLFSYCSRKSGENQESFNSFQLPNVIIQNSSPRLVTTPTSTPVKILKSIVNLRWNGSYLNGTAILKLDKQNTNKLYLFKNKELKVISVFAGKSSLNYNDKNHSFDYIPNTKTIIVKFALRVNKIKDKAVLISSALFNIGKNHYPPESFSIHSVSMKLYLAKGWIVRGNFTGNADTSPLEYKGKSFSLDVLLYKNSVFLDLTDYKLFGFSSGDSPETLKKLHKVQTLREKIRSCTKEKYPDEIYYYFSSKNDGRIYGLLKNIKYLPKNFNILDVIQQEICHKIPLLPPSGQNAIIRKAFINAVSCKIAGCVNKSLEQKCLHKLNEIFLDGYSSVNSLKYDPFIESRDYRIAKLSLLFSGLINWNYKTNNIENILFEQCRDLKIGFGAEKLVNSCFKKTPKNWKKLLRKRGTVIGRVVSVIKKEKFSIVKIINRGDSKWVVPLVYKTDKGSLTKRVILPDPGKIKSIKLNMKGNPLNIELDPHGTTLMLPFGWTREGPPVKFNK